MSQGHLLALSLVLTGGLSLIAQALAVVLASLVAPLLARRGARPRRSLGLASLSLLLELLTLALLGELGKQLKQTQEELSMLASKLIT